VCGFLGRVSRRALAEGERKRLERALDTLAHRGPDDRRVLALPHHWLGFRRLAILDLSPAGGQPQSRGDWDVVYNGEVYNFADLRGRLPGAAGVESSGDAEVVARWIAAHGADGAADFEGMFAIAAVRRDAREALLLRDRFGVKPLYFAEDADGLWFASEPRAIVAAREAAAAPDRDALARYFALGVCVGEATAFAGIRRVPPGGCVRYRPGAGVEISRWYRWPPAAAALARADDDALAATLRQAVGDCLVSDVPLGVFLSGGIDSGLVVAFAARAARESGGPAPLALTVGFPSDATRDESDVARAVARHLGARHEVVALAPSEARVPLEEVAETYDEPFSDSSALPTLLLARTAARHATVWLSGDGGDEGFGGYPSYAAGMRWAGGPRVPAALRAALRLGARLIPPFSILRYRAAKLAVPPDLAPLAFTNFPLDPALDALLTPRARAALAPALAPVAADLAPLAALPPSARLRAVDYAFFLEPDGLVKVDRASMHHSLEVRVPLLDSRVAALAAAWPAADLVAGGAGKQPLRRLAQALLPPGVAALGKRGFGVPLQHVFGADDERRVLAAAERSALAREWLRLDGMRALFAAWRAAGLEPGRDLGPLVWRAVAFVLWSERWLGV
jgi:asparagine synthase (glutamine-hydrolysing)